VSFVLKKQLHRKHFHAIWLLSFIFIGLFFVVVVDHFLIVKRKGAIMKLKFPRFEKNVVIYNICFFFFVFYVNCLVI